MGCSPSKSDLVLRSACGQETRPGRCLEIIAQRTLMKSGPREVFCQSRFPVSLIYVVSPSPAVPSTLCRFPLVVLQQASQSFSTPHCSHLPPWLRPGRKQDPIVFALMVALLVVMYDISLQRSPQRRFSKQDQPRQTFFFDRPYPAFRVRVQIRASCWQSKRMHASRLDQFSKGLAEFRVSVMQQIAAASQASPLLHSHVSRLLLHPLLIRVRRESCQMHPACLQVDEEQHSRSSTP
jgi:hypothetical protein